MRRSVAVACTSALLLAAEVAAAEPRDPAAAEALFRDGRAAVRANDWAHACPQFAESYRLDPAPGTLLNLADCEEHVGQITSAWQHFKQLSEQVPPGDERQPLALERAAALDRRIPRVKVTLSPGAPADARVLRDDVELGPASLGAALPVNPGEHTVLVVASGRFTTRQTFRVGERETRTLEVAAGVEDPGSLDPGAGRRTAGWIVGGVGVGALATGAVFGVVALTKRAQSDAGCTNGMCRDASSASAYDDAKSSARVADIMLGVGVVGVVVGAVLIVTAPRAEEPRPRGEARARAGLRLTTSGASLSW